MSNESNQLSADNPIVKIGWNDFRETGLFRFVNAFLHIFGYVIVMEVEDDGTVKSVFPAKTIWRGFSADAMSESYQKVAELMAKDHEEILKFAKDDG